MGTWGDGNLQNDSALDELADRTPGMVKALIDRAKRPSSRECDDYDYTTLFVDFEIIFALDAKRLLESTALPPPDEVEELKWDYIRDWDVNIDQLGPTPEHKKGRRRCILRTFDRFKRICLRIAERRAGQAAAAEWVEVTPPTLEELMAGVGIRSHKVFDNLLISLPKTWTVRRPRSMTDAPEFLLTRRFFDADSQCFIAKTLSIGSDSGNPVIHGRQDHPFRVDNQFFATGRSLVPDNVPNAADPYVLLMRISSPDNAPIPDNYDLVFGSDHFLSPFYGGDREHLSGGPWSINTHGQLEFMGIESFRPVPPPAGEGLSQFQNLYFHRLADNALLLLEIGGVQDSAEEFFPDRVLVDHLAFSLEQARQDTD